jgi:hypothetical protein
MEKGGLKEVTETRLGGKNSYISAFWYSDEYKIVVAQFIELNRQDASHKSSNYISGMRKKKLTG